jgi:tRNA (mo5U34)-methyltransferase
VENIDLENLKREREKWLSWKNIAPLQKSLKELKDITGEVKFIDGKVSFNGDIGERDEVLEIAKSMKPWRKGPFQIDDILIDAEWRSDIKYSIIEPYLQIEGKVVGDIGCNNGYYMFRMLEKNPEKIVGFDPSPLFKTQFQFINHFVKSEIEYELLGVEHLPIYEQNFDTLLCLGVLYHRSDPVATLRSLRDSLNLEGTLILDTFIIDGEEEMALFPDERYSKIPNIYFVPTVKALQNWVKRAKFKSFELIGVYPTTKEEQRKTEWIDGESLNNFLDEVDSSKTVEGYPAPKRAYVKLRK